VLAWVPAVLVGDAWLAWWWPVVAIGAFVCVPSLRVHWWPRRSGRTVTRRRWHVATAAVCVVAVGRWFVEVMRKRPLPGVDDLRVHPDLWFQQGLVNQLQHTLQVQVSQVAGVPKRYHWFSNADVAATSQMSGVPSTTVLFHLWLVVMTVTMVLAATALARRLMDDGDGEGAGRWWVGPVAALLVAAVPVTVVLGEPRLRNLGNGFVSVSTSGILGLVVMLVLSGPVIELLRGRGGRGTWALAILLMALAAGTKPSNLPIAIAALGLVATVRYWRTRRFPATPVVLAVVALVLIGASAFKLMGGEGGTGVLPFQTLELDPAMKAADGGSAARVLLVGLGLFGLYVVTELPRLLGMLGIVHRRTRADPAIWWTAGVVFAGFCASWLVSQPGYSQQYFWRVVIVLAVVASMAVAVRVVPDDVRPRDVAGPLTTVVVAGLAVGAWVLQWPEVDATDPDTGAFVRLVPYALAAVVLAAAVGLWRLPVLRRSTRALPVLPLVLAFSLAAGTPAAVDDLREPVRLAVTGRPMPYSQREAPRLVTVEEQRAALWLRDHAGDGEDPGTGRVVTNVVCVPTRYAHGCEATGFWVGALSGLPVVLGGWAYAEAGRDKYPSGSDGPSYKNRPAPYPERLRLSLEMIRNPSAGVARQLREKYHARWVFADRRATPVSPAIARYADLRYRNSDVLVYELR
ncbi:MAG: hypothetical protein ACRDO8_10420, partial [Nocardioidaceae bacterium]